MSDLDFTNLMYKLGKQFGTDKITHHNYHLIYPTYLEKFYAQTGGMIEIGLEPKWGKASLNMWLEIFPKMHIYGLDRGTPDEFAQRYTILKCDQSDGQQLDDCLKKINHPIYFINDDGSHIPEHQLLTFNKLFPLLEINGVYIIEDIETSYWTKEGLYGYETRYGKGHSKSIVEIFKNAVDGVNVEFSQSTEGKVEHQQEIGSITFAKNCIIITKRDTEFREYRFQHKL